MYQRINEKNYVAEIAQNKKANTLLAGLPTMKQPDSPQGVYRT